MTQSLPNKLALPQAPLPPEEVSPPEAATPPEAAPPPLSDLSRSLLGYSPAPRVEIGRQHGDMGAVQAAANRFSDVATYGGFNYGVVGAARKLGGDERAEDMKQSLRTTQEEHETAGAIGAALGYLAPSPVSILRGAAGAARIAAAAAKPLTFIGRTARAAAWGGAELAQYGMGEEFSEQVLGNAPINGEKIVSAGLVSAVLGAAGGGAFHVAGEGAGAALKGASKIAGKAASFIKGGGAEIGENEVRALIDAGMTREQAVGRLAKDKPGLLEVAENWVIDNSDMTPEKKEFWKSASKADKARAMSGDHDGVLRDAAAGIKTALDDLHTGSVVLDEYSNAGLKREVIAPIVDSSQGALEKQAEAYAARLAEARGSLKAAIISTEAVGGEEMKVAKAVLEDVERDLAIMRKMEPPEFNAPEAPAVKPFEPKPPPEEIVVQNKWRNLEEWSKNPENAGVGSEKFKRELQFQQEAAARENVARLAKYEQAEHARIAAYDAEVAEVRDAHLAEVAKARAAHDAMADRLMGKGYKDPVDLVTSADRIKRNMDTYARMMERAMEGPAGVAPERATAYNAALDALRPSAAGIRTMLEDSTLFGEFGNAQKEMNAARSRQIDMERHVRRDLFLEMGTEPAPGGKAYRKQYEADSGDVRRHVEGLSNSDNNEVNKRINGWVDGVARVAATHKKYYALDPAAAQAIASVERGVAAVRKNYTEATAAIEFANHLKALKGASGPGWASSGAAQVVGGVAGSMLGGHLGAGLGGAVASKAAAYASKPMEAMRAIAGLRTGIAKASEWLDGNGFFTAPAKGERLSDGELKTIIVSVGDMARDPGKLAERMAAAVSSFSAAAPKHAAAAGVTLSKAVMYLHQERPKDKRPESMLRRGGEPVYAPSELAAYRTKVAVALDPSTVASLAARDMLDRHAVAALNAVYPGMYEELKRGMMLKAADPKLELTIQRQAMYAVLFKMAMSPSTDRKFIAGLQKPYAPADKAAKTSSPSRPIKLESYQTLSQRVEGRGRK